MFPQPELEELLQVRSTDTFKEALNHRAIPEDPALWEGDVAHKIRALSRFKDSTRMTNEMVTFVQEIDGLMQRGFQLRTHSDRGHRQNFHSLARVARKELKRPMPPVFDSLDGRCATVSGTAGQGKTRLWQRLNQAYPSAMELRGTLPAPTKMWVIPFFYQPYPFDGTFFGFMQDMHTRLLSHTMQFGFTEDIFEDLLNTNIVSAANAAVAILSFFNVGMFVLDGFSAAAINADANPILAFVGKLKDWTSIPVVLSGTDAWMNAAGLTGTKGTCIFNGPSLSLLPTPNPMKGGEEKYVSSLWYKQNQWMWENGVFSPTHTMPPALPIWTYDLTYGNLDWLSLGFQALHVAIAKDATLLEREKLTQDEVRRHFLIALRLLQPARNFMDVVRDKPKGVNKFDFVHHIDRLTLAEICRYNKYWVQKSHMRAPWLAK